MVLSGTVQRIDNSQQTKIERLKLAAQCKTLANVRFEGLSASRLGYLEILGPIAGVGILRVHGRKCIFDNAADNRAAG